MTETDYALVIGNKNYSSWSLRPWLAMRRFGVPFREINIDIYTPGARQRILEHSPSGKVPALKTGRETIWDTLAILETLAERFPEHAWWPSDAGRRALARSVSAEMHSGFADLRAVMPMDLLHEKPMEDVPGAVAADIARIVAVWRSCRAAAPPGDFLFGDFSIADAMYAPVASRFRTYVPDLAVYGDDGIASAYVETVFAMPEITEWCEAAARELAASPAAD